jgi:gliding motility-associated-like protein
MDNKKDIGQVFRDGFQNFEAQPPEHVWKNVASQIQSGAPPSGFHLPFYAYIIASMLLVAGLVVGYLQIDPPASKVLSDEKTVQTPDVTSQPMQSDESGITALASENQRNTSYAPESNTPRFNNSEPLPQPVVTRKTVSKPESEPLQSDDSPDIAKIPARPANRGITIDSASPAVTPEPAQNEAEIERIAGEQLVTEPIISRHDISVCRGEEVVLNAGDGSRYQWSQGGYGQSFTLIADDNRQILVDYISLDGQAAQQIFNIRILDCSVFIPKAFSPNDDGFNDVFRVRAEGISHFDMKIFSKWGELVYHTRNAEAGWDGRIRGIRAPAGIYIYQINYNDPNQNTRANFGTLTLLP